MCVVEGSTNWLKASSMHTDCLYRCWWKPIVLWVFSFFFSSLLPFALVLTISLSFPPSFLLCHLAAVFTVQYAGKQVFDMKPVCVCVCARFLLSEMWSQIASFPAFIYVFFLFVLIVEYLKPLLTFSKP